jgi:hypothetical protein
VRLVSIEVWRESEVVEEEDVQWLRLAKLIGSARGLFVSPELAGLSVGPELGLLIEPLGGEEFLPGTTTTVSLPTVRMMGSSGRSCENLQPCCMKSHWPVRRK